MGYFYPGVRPAIVPLPDPINGQRGHPVTLVSSGRLMRQEPQVPPCEDSLFKDSEHSTEEYARVEIGIEA